MVSIASWGAIPVRNVRSGWKVHLRRSGMRADAARRAHTAAVPAPLHGGRDDLAPKNKRPALNFGFSKGHV
jgi:hypothetical protein